MTTPATLADHRSAYCPTATMVRIWLSALACMVFVMILLGGATRLTDSGLSMVEWQPLSILPPTSDVAWQATFEKYRTSPQYLNKNVGMTLGEFKEIFWLEYIHRLWGRLIGFAAVLPLLWFAARRALPRALVWRMGGLVILGGLQGGLGWFMVASGLVDRPDVSQYRLAAHLGLGVLLYAALIWLVMTHNRPYGGFNTPGRLALAFAGWVWFVMISGAFVAGLDAGLTYNTFPLMDGHWIPPGLGELTPWWRNAFENVVSVQFNHRILAMTTVLFAAGLWLGLRRHPAGGAASRHALIMVLLAAMVQAGLGITTLILAVPVAAGVAHQAGALLLLTAALHLAAINSRRLTVHG